MILPEERGVQAHDVMTTHPSVVPRTETIAAAARMMRDRRIRMLPVVDAIRSKKLLGVITDHDIVVRCVAKGHDGAHCSAGDHMTEDGLVSVQMDADVHDVARKMERARLRRIPVVTSDGRLVGVIAFVDLAARLPAKEATLVLGIQQSLMTARAQPPAG